MRSSTHWKKPSVGFLTGIDCSAAFGATIMRPYIPIEVRHMFYSGGTTVLLSTSYKDNKGHANTLIYI